MMPFGRPVVPDEYSIGVPSDSSAIGVVGCRLIAVDVVDERRSSIALAGVAAVDDQEQRHASGTGAAPRRDRRASPSDVISTFDSLLSTMYASSSAVRCELMHV